MFERKIKIFQSDGGGEFTSHFFKNHLSNCRIHHQLSCPTTVERNGVAERKHRHIVETGKSHRIFLAATSTFIPKTYKQAMSIIVWQEAMR